MNEVAPGANKTAYIESAVSGTAKALPKLKKVRLSLLLLVVAAVFSLTFIISEVRIGARVSVNGVSVGSVADIRIVEAAVAAAEERISRVVGRDYDVSYAVSTEKVIVNDGASLDEGSLTTAIIDSVDVIDEYLVVSVGGIEIGSVKSAETITAAMNRIFDMYRTENTKSIYLDTSFSYTGKSAPVSSELSEDELVAKMESMIAEGSLSVITIREEYAEDVIAYNTVEVENTRMYLDETAVVSEGKNGSVMRGYDATYINGNYDCSRLVSCDITENAVSEVVEVGSMPLPAPTGRYIWPATGRITSDFGPRNLAIGSKNHKGIDIGADWNSKILAVDDGVVTYSGWMSGYGNIVELYHGNGIYTRYAHCRTLLVYAGQEVSQGDSIARVGNTGISSGPHLHFELRADGEALDPLRYLPDEQ